MDAGTAGAVRDAHHIPPVMPAASVAAIPAHARTPMRPLFNGAMADGMEAAPGAGAGASSSSRATPMCGRRFGACFSRHRRSSVITAGGVDGGSRDQSGSFVMTAMIVSVTSSPSKAREPVSISKSTAPKAQMSARRSTGLPLACSGDM